MPTSFGLEWKETLFGLEPHWSVEPQVENIQEVVRNHLGISKNQKCDIELYKQGAFNKIYIVRLQDACRIMRVSLPVDPSYKTLSEVATLSFVKKISTIPVPSVIDYDESAENDICFEWMLMEFMPGRTLADKWRDLSMANKEKLIKRLAQCTAELFRINFPAIGNIYEFGVIQGLTAAKIHSYRPMFEIPRQIWRFGDCDLQDSDGDTDFAIGPLVSMEIFWGKHLDYRVLRGPYQSSKSWLKARLAFAEKDSQLVLHSGDEDEVEDANTTLRIITRLEALLDSEFYPNGADTSFAMRHDDLSLHNLLVDDNGELAAVLDWECASSAPLWKVCQLPKLLESRNRAEPPIKSTYIFDKDDNVNSLYWEHLQEHELTKLRAVFLEEMREIVPEWVKIYEESTRKADIDLAIQQCDSELSLRTITRWLDNIDAKGEYWSLKEKFMA